MTCVLCAGQIVVYDRYPLLDGTFYTSPINQCDRGVPIRNEKQGWLMAM